MTNQPNISTNGTKDIPSTGSVQENPMNDIRDDDTLKEKIGLNELLMQTLKVEIAQKVYQIITIASSLLLIFIH